MSSPTRPITELRIGGTTYRVQSSADETDLSRLAALVDARIAELPNVQRHDTRSLVLVALALAHDLELEQRAHRSLREQVASRLTDLVGRIDDALDHCDEHGDPLPPIPRWEDASEEQRAPATPATPASVSPTEPPEVATHEPSAAPRRAGSRSPRGANATDETRPTPRGR
jgi:cell division protein ZapA (FtsZ GTPase activity inhibitor)